MHMHKRMGNACVGAGTCAHAQRGSACRGGGGLSPQPGPAQAADRHWVPDQGLGASVAEDFLASLGVATQRFMAWEDLVGPLDGLRSTELKGTLWIIESSSCQGGTVGN